MVTASFFPRLQAADTPALSLILFCRFTKISPNFRSLSKFSHNRLSKSRCFRALSAMELRLVYESDGSTTNNENHNLDRKESEVEVSKIAIGNGKKNGAQKESGHSILNSVSRIVSQIKKPAHRRSGSPLNWFPRKKADSYLKRKIRLLQENEGMNLSLDETLGNANPHYTRIAREKIAAREAARKAMTARKAAMVEASWWRILRAARIQSKAAEVELEKAEKFATEAFEAARAKGVMMYDRPDSPRKLCEVESHSSLGGRSTHTVTASFETAFEVDKEVMVAVKEAFIQFVKCPPSSNKEEFKDLLWKISQNPDSSETDLESTELSSESFIELVNIMLNRLKGLEEDALSSLVTIVATCGLNAALLKLEYSKDREQGVTGARRISSATRFIGGYSNIKEMVTEVPSLDKFLVKHVSRLEREVQEARKSNCQKTQDAELKRTTSPEPVTEVPSLDKFLVKRVSRLEREVQEARNSNCQKSHDAELKPTTSSEPVTEVPSLDKFMVKHVSRLEREVQEARNSNYQKTQNTESKPSEYIPDLGSILVKHVSKLEKEVNEARNSHKNNFVVERECEEFRNSEVLSENRENPFKHGQFRHTTVSSYQYKENMDSNTLVSTLEKDHVKCSPVKHLSRLERAKLEVLNSFSSNEQSSLDNILVKPVHRLEREKTQAVGTENESISTIKKRNQQIKNVDSLDEILVKHQSKLEKAMLAASQQPLYEIIKNRKHGTEVTGSESLDKILVRHQPELEKAKLSAAQNSEDYIKLADARKEAREKELQEAWGGLSLGNSMRTHLSRLEQDRRAEDEERKLVREVMK